MSLPELLLRPDTAPDTGNVRASTTGSTMGKLPPGACGIPIQHSQTGTAAPERPNA